MTKEQAFEAWWTNFQHETHPTGNPTPRYRSAVRPIARDAFMGAWAILNDELETAKRLECDCTAVTSPDGRTRTFCSSAQMMRALEVTSTAKVSGAGTASAGLPGWQANGETE